MSAQLGLGTWQLGGPAYANNVPTGWGEVTEAEALATLNEALAGGIRFIDTADSYGAGQSERLVGRALAAFAVPPGTLPVEVCTKFGNRRNAQNEPIQDYSPTWLAEAVDESLARLQRPALDILLLHSPPDTFDWAAYDTELFEALIRAGKIRAYGVSSRSVYGAKRVMDAGFGSVLEVIYNALDRRAETVLFTHPRASAYRFIGRVPLASGFLNDTYLTQNPAFRPDEYRRYLLPRDHDWLLESARKLAFLAAETGGLRASALRFCLGQSALSVVIPGMRTAAQVQSNLLAAQLGPLPVALQTRISEAVPDVPPHWKPA